MVRKLTLLAIAIVLVACKGDQGPLGPRGDQGVQGSQGVQGVEGSDGTDGAQGEKGDRGEAGETLNWADVIEKGRLEGAIYVVGVFIDDRPFPVGTAFSAYFTDRLWTNAHVVESVLEDINDPELAESTVIPFATRGGTLIGGDETYVWDSFTIHPEYDPDVLWGPDIALINIAGEITHEMPSFLPREFTDNLRVGQPLGTLGFPRLLAIMDRILPIANFKDGTISALRPYYNADFLDFPRNTGRIIHYNLSTLGGTSGSPVFDHEGFIVAINFAGISIPIILPPEEGEEEGTLLERIETDENFGVNIIAAWEFLDYLASIDSTVNVAGRRTDVGVVESSSQPYPHDEYQPEPYNWNGETVAP